uniref:(northern house mosquito) hypothetical protein n=1 Tax=Culex pipiens TaxID=7175 RepID=A0A8D8ATN8_CULPI
MVAISAWLITTTALNYDNIPFHTGHSFTWLGRWPTPSVQICADDRLTRTATVARGGRASLSHCSKRSTTPVSTHTRYRISSIQMIRLLFIITDLLWDTLVLVGGKHNKHTSTLLNSKTTAK